MELRTKRAYAPPKKLDGRRVLVDRLWPRGIAKGSAQIHYWARDVAPSATLRSWFGHDPARWGEFRLRYFRELRGNEGALEALANALVGAHRVTLVYGARDERHNNAVALAEYLHEYY